MSVWTVRFIYISPGWTEKICPNGKCSAPLFSETLVAGLAKSWPLFTYRDCIFIAYFQTVCKKAAGATFGRKFVEERNCRKKAQWWLSSTKPYLEPERWLIETVFDAINGRGITPGIPKEFAIHICLLIKAVRFCSLFVWKGFTV